VTRLAEAEEAVENAGVDLVLLDLSLPDSQGFETFERLLSHGRNVPILMLSGVDDESLALRMVHAGAQDYLVKGKFDAALLVRAMRYAIERNGAERELAQEKNLVRALLETLPDRIFFKDRESRFLRVNPAMARFSSSSGPRMRSARRTSISSCRSTRSRPWRMNRRSCAPGSRS
jgi:two-component system cell cycle sensor histidine kinase/response regulator CckA